MPAVGWVAGVPPEHLLAMVTMVVAATAMGENPVTLANNKAEMYGRSPPQINYGILQLIRFVPYPTDLKPPTWAW